jgi:hypothetical protein
MTRDDTVAGHDLIRHTEVAATVGDERIGFFEGIGIEQEGDAFAGGQFSSVALAAKPFFTATGLRLAPHVCQLRQRIYHRVHDVDGRVTVAHTLAAWAFSQSFRNRSSPISVSGCLKHCSITAAGAVTTSAPIRAASTT